MTPEVAQAGRARDMPAPIARVTASTRDTTFADASGRYSLSVPASTDSIRIDAKDGFAPIPHVRTCVHETRVLATHSQTVDTQSRAVRPDAQLGRYLVPGAGLEPARACAQRILSPLRLPFRHPGTIFIII